MRRSALTLVFALTSLVALPTAAEAARYDPYKLTGTYKLGATITSTAYTKRVCNTGSHIVTDEVTTTFVSNRSGSAKLGTKRRPTTGSMKSSGTRTIHYSKVVQGPDAAPPQSNTVSEQMGTSKSSSSPISRSMKKPLLLVQLNVSELDRDNGILKVKPPKRGKSTTVSVEEDRPMKQSSDSMCNYMERSSVKGEVTVTRVR